MKYNFFLFFLLSPLVSAFCLSYVGTEHLDFTGQRFLGNDSLSSFVLRNGDRVVFLGDTFVERAQEFGYLELALTTRWPSRNIKFRNLGWSGDTVYGDSRGHYTQPPTAYEHLVDQVTSAEPTHLFICYGANLAFEEMDGVDHFLKGLNNLLDDLSDSTKAQIVLLSPPPHEPDISPSDPEMYNENLRQASTAIQRVASQRGYRFIDLFHELRRVIEDEDRLLTTNGIYYNAVGYYYAAHIIEKGLELPVRDWKVVLDTEAGTAQTDGSTVADLRGDQQSVAFTLKHEHLPVPFPEANAGSEEPFLSAGALSVKGLRSGQYELLEEGQVVATASAQDWAEGVVVQSPISLNRAEQIRSLIKEKNQLYFYRYRPQNETYLVGFRKYEQGQNAGELDQFDVLIDEKELEIGHLRQPEPHRYELIRVSSR